MTTVFALLGAKALYLLYLWLASAIIASFLSDRKGYGEKAGLASGLLLSVVAVIVWLVWPAKSDSRWKLQGPFGRKKGAGSLAAERAKLDHR
jgi:hypothetical protein